MKRSNMIGLMLFLTMCAGSLIAAPAGFRTLSIGDAAPDFKLPGVDDKSYTLASFSDAKILMVIFTCNHCPTAQGYEERIKAIYQEYKPKGVALVAISPNDPLAVRLDELGYTDLGDALADMKVRAEQAGPQARPQGPDPGHQRGRRAPASFAAVEDVDHIARVDAQAGRLAELEIFGQLRPIRGQAVGRFRRPGRVGARLGGGLGERPDGTGQDQRRPAPRLNAKGH